MAEQLAESLDEWCARRDVGSVRMAIPGDEHGEDAALVPLCLGHLDDDALLEDLAAWRNASVEAFPTRFVATVESTRRWLSVVLDGDRALLLIEGRGGERWGHVGLRGYRGAGREVELENIVRGVATAPRGVMTRAMMSLLALCENGGAPRQRLSVFSDNEHAIRFYERLGFVRGAMTPLKRSRRDDGVVTLEPLDAGDRAPADEFLLEMRRVSA